MLIKTLILDCNKSMLKIFRYLINRLVYSIGTRRYKTFNLSASVISINESSKSFRFNVRSGNMRSVINNLFYKKPAAGHSDYCSKYDTDQQCLEQTDNDAFPLHCRFGRYFFLPFRSLFLSIVHAFKPPLYQVIIANVHSFIKKKMKTSYLSRKILRN